MNKKLFFIAGLVTSFLTIVAFARYEAPFAPRLVSQTEARASSITASGFIEAEQVSIAAESGGKIKELKVAEGERVKAGQLLAALDDTLLVKQINQAETAIEVARANLALIKAGAREEEIRQRKAALAQAEALRVGAKQAWDNARAIRDNPQDLNARIIAAQGQLDVAERNVALSKKVWDNAVNDYEASLREAQSGLRAANLQIDQAQTNVDQTERLKVALQQPITAENWIRPPFGIQNTLQYDLYVFQSQLAQEALSLTQANRDATQSRMDRLVTTQALAEVSKRQYDLAASSRDAAKSALDDLLATRQNPLSLRAQVDSAEAQYQQAIAAVEMARAALDAALAGPTPEQIKVAEALVKQAESALQLLQAQKEKTEITSPVNGMIAQKGAQKGEIVLLGVSFLKITNLETVTLKVFIPETQIGQLKVGSPAQVMVDSYPDRPFAGKVTFISPQAEFTPKDIQTKEERTKTVFAIKVTMDNPEGILKPGMPADATIEVG